MDKQQKDLFALAVVGLGALGAYMLWGPHTLKKPLTAPSVPVVTVAAATPSTPELKAKELSPDEVMQRVVNLPRRKTVEMRNPFSDPHPRAVGASVRNPPNGSAASGEPPNASTPGTSNLLPPLPLSEVGTVPAAIAPVILTGIVQGQPSVAVLEVIENGERRTSVLRAGQRVTAGKDGYLLTAIGGDFIKLRRAEQTIIVKLGAPPRGGETHGIPRASSAAAVAPAAGGGGTNQSHVTPGR